MPDPSNLFHAVVDTARHAGLDTRSAEQLTVGEWMRNALHQNQFPVPSSPPSFEKLTYGLGAAAEVGQKFINPTSRLGAVLGNNYLRMFAGGMALITALGSLPKAMTAHKTDEHGKRVRDWGATIKQSLKTVAGGLVAYGCFSEKVNASMVDWANRGR